MSVAKLVGVLAVALLLVSGSFANAQTIQLNGQRLEIHTAGNHDVVSVMHVGTDVAVTIFEFDPSLPPPPPTTPVLDLALQSISTTFASFPAVDVADIEIKTRGGDDTVVIDPAITLPSFIKTGAGDDLVFGGSGPDMVHCGAGDDVAIGFDGLDTLFGGNGTDALEGGQDGHVDILAGGRDADSFFSYYDSAGVIVEQDVVLDFDVTEGDTDDDGIF